MKLLIFHPAIAPYRIDFFNSLFKNFDSRIVLHYKNLKSQKFDYNKIEEALEFEPQYLTEGMKVLGRTSYRGYGRNLGDFEPALVVTSEYGIGTWKAYIYRLITRARYKIISICDDSERIAKKCSGFRRLSRDFLCRRIDGLILCDKAAQIWYNKQFPQLKTAFFPIIREAVRFRSELADGLDAARELIRKYDLIGKKVFLYVGRISRVKNLEYMVSSFIKAHKRHADIRLFVVGDVSANNVEADVQYKKKIMADIRESDAAEYIRLVGRCEGEELMAWYNVGQVFVLPSTYEPFGAVINEALLAGQYVMVSKNAGARCLVYDGMALESAVSSGKQNSAINGEIIDIDKEYIDFERAIDKTAPINEKSCCSLRDNVMEMDFDDYMKGLIKFMNGL